MQNVASFESHLRQLTFPLKMTVLDEMHCVMLILKNPLVSPSSEMGQAHILVCPICKGVMKELNPH